MDITISVMSVILVGAATIILFLLATVLVKESGEKRKRIPPGPRAFPVIGHFHLFMDKTKPVHRILSSLSALHGPIMHLKFGSRPVLVISSSDLAKECFTVNDRSCASRPSLTQAQYLGYNYNFLSWAPYGPYWRNVRKICVLELLSLKRIHSFGPQRMQEIKKALNSLFQQSQLQGVVDTRSAFARLTFKVLMSMIVNERYFGEESGIDLDSVTHLIEESFVLHGVIDIGDYIPWLKRFDLQGYAKAMKDVTKKLDLYMQMIVEKHREKRSHYGEGVEDFVDVLISQAEENEGEIPDVDAFIKSTALVMLSAGSDTTSLTLEWALALLLKHPDAMRKAQEEIDYKVGRKRMVEEADIGQLTYLQGIVKETLRLYPPGPLLMPHKSIEACTVGGYHIPAETMLMVNVWEIQRDPKVWKNASDFVPERFMEGGVEMDNVQVKGNEFEMLPFGAGRRGCPGTALAMSVLHTSLASLLQSFDWSVPDGKMIDMTEAVGIAMPRAVPLEAFIKPRLAHHLYSLT